MKFRRIKKYLLLSIVYSLWPMVLSPLYAEEITILYTGSTHAMLYQCSCPVEPDGGIARRATLVKQLRKENPNILLLDSGRFFAGGIMDEYTQNSKIDMQRTLVNLKAMELMKYDAVAISDNEFNFGRQFLEEKITVTGMPFLSCNIEPDSRKSYAFSLYIIKELADTKIGIIGVTTLLALPKAEGLRILEPKPAVKKAVKDLKRRGVDIIILLSNLDDSEISMLIKEVGGIDIVIVSEVRGKQESYEKIGPTLFLRPSWQGRKLDKLSLTLQNKKIINYRIEELRLSDKVSDDPEVLSILPRCFSDADCKKEGMVGICQEPGSLKSNCIFSKARKISLLVITPKVCATCDTEKVIRSLQRTFPGLKISYFYYPDARAKKLIRDFNLKGLPVYLLGKEIEKEKGFNNFKKNVEVKGNFYLLRPAVSGVAYFLDREKIKGRLDLFISLYDSDNLGVLNAVKDFNPVVHFLAMEKDGGFQAARGNLEVEDYLRSVCVKRYYPQRFLDYISCRARNIDSSWWQDCLSGLDTDKIKSCAQGQAGKVLLQENISLNRELGIMFGTTYLVDNQEAFSSRGTPAKKDLDKIIHTK